jgi:Raf kinase inhibitor-like YbhB/YbcL family protein
MTRSAAAVVLGLAVAGLVGCGGDASSPADADVPDGIDVTSTAFAEGGSIPVRYTCDGEEVSPPLTWSGVPAGATALALVVDDPDAPSGTFTHWIVVDIPPTTTESPEGGAPAGGVQASTSAGGGSYAGPCPPSGTHHYRFTVLALDEPTGLDQGAPLDEALAAVDEHAIASGTLAGTYSRE